MATVEVSVNSSHSERSLPAGYHWCHSCKVHVVKDGYDLCFGCERKWQKVFKDCCDHGWPDDIARCKADDAYPGRH